MNFRIQKSEFLRGLRMAQGIADRKGTMPILANVLLRTSGKKQLIVAATDLNVSVSAELSANIDQDGGLTVSAKHLHDIVSSLPEEDVVFRRGDNHWAEIRAGKVKYKLVGMPDRDFPKIADHREIKFGNVDTSILRGMIDRTLFSVSNDETRFHLNGVFFESDGNNARMVSTDGHRLSKADSSLKGGPKLQAGVIVPKKGLVEMKRALEAASGKCKFAVLAPHLFLQVGGIALAIMLIDAEFPPYDQVIPQKSERTAVLVREELLDALKRAQLMSSETRGVKLSLSKGRAEIASDNPELGEVNETMDSEYTGEAISIGFNPKYFAEVLSHISSEKIRIELSGELDPAVIRPIDSDDYLGVVMPMRF